jgi:hypothetical protein
MLEDVLTRIEHRLKVVGLSPTAASRAAGLSEDAIRNMRRAAAAKGGRTGVTTRTISALAPILKTNVSWLLEGAGDEDDADRRSPTTVPVVGYVKAGAEAVLYAEGQGPFDEVPAPEGATEKTVAVEIRGESLGEFFDEWLVYYDDVRSPITPDQLGQLCVVGLPDGRVLVKKVRPAREPGLYHLLSQTEGPILDQEVEWAALVKQMSPR